MSEHAKRMKRELVMKGTILDVYKDTMELPNGKTEEWDFVSHRKGAAAVVAVREDGKLLMVRQYRNALERMTLEIPAGARDSVTEDIYAKQFVVIDVNGWQKRPNRSGYDLFLFSISRDGKVTAGGADTSFYPKSGYCNSSTTFSRNGYGCTINAINEKDYFQKLPH